MNIELSYLIGPISGGIIGYFTNWLAIKMMFRPQQPKYLFGVKLPFTPGLIPKEHGRIAEAIEHLVLAVDDPLEGVAEIVVDIIVEDRLDQFGRLEIRCDPFYEEDVLASLVGLFVALADVDQREGVLLVVELAAEGGHVRVVDLVVGGEIEAPELLDTLSVVFPDRRDTGMLAT